MKTRYSLVASALALSVLSACNDANTTMEEGTFDPSLNQATPSRVNYNPIKGIVPIPNDLLFSGSIDGTLEMPDEVAATSIGTTPDLSNPAAVLGSLDGWSTQMPKQVTLTMAEEATIDSSSLGPNSVYVIEAKMGGSTGCETVPIGAACAPVDTLRYGTDYIATTSGADITIVPLQPLKPATTYLIAINNNVKDSRGEAVAGSEIYEQLSRDDIVIAHESLGPLQGLLNSYEAVIAATPDVDTATPIYSAAWTTSSVGNALGASLSIAQTMDVQIRHVSSAGITVEQALIDAGVLPPEAAGTTAYQLADLHHGDINLPYYLSDTSPKTQAWQAMCDSPVTLSNTDETTLANATAGENHAACQAISEQLVDLGLDSHRYITKYNYVPQLRSTQTVNIQITTPNSVAGPWPIIMLQHGITSTKEDMLLVTGALANAGFATVAIDHPLHGERGFTLDDGSIINASTQSATDYLNLEYLLVARDNMKQSVADLLALRLALANGISGDLDNSHFNLNDIHFAGMSLGGLTGVDFVATANANNLPVQRASFVAAGGGIAPFLIESQQFGSLIQASVLSGAGTDLSTEFTHFVTTGDATCASFSSDLEAYTACMYTVFYGQQHAENDLEALAEINGHLAAFSLAAQTVLDSADPNNYAATIQTQVTPVYMTAIVGDGVNNLSDQVIPNKTSSVPIGGTAPLANFIGLSAIDESTIGAGSGLVRFTAGGHSSLLNPSSSAEVTTEMQTQLANFHATGVINVTNAAVVAPASNM